MHLDIPTIGVAKKMYFFGTLLKYSQGGFEALKAKLVNPFDTLELEEKGDPLGYVLLSNRESQPIYVSPGYGISRSTSLMIVKWCFLEKNKGSSRRLPEPVFAADLCSRRRAAEINLAMEPKNELLDRKWRRALQLHKELDEDEKFFWGKCLKYKMKIQHMAKFYNEEKTSKVSKRSDSICSTDSGIASEVDEVDEVVTQIKSMQFTRRVQKPKKAKNTSK